MFKARDSFAINLSDASIEALELIRNRGGLRVKAYNRVLLESGVVEDGAIKDEEKLLSAVTQLIKEAKPEAVTAKEVIVTLPESKVFAQSISLPKSMSAKQVSAALYAQAKELLPIDVTSIAADYIETGRNGDIVDYLFVATYKELVESYTNFFQKVGLKVTMVTMESLALGVAILSPDTEETALVLDIGARTTIASIFTEGRLRETININIAGVNITRALAEKLKISEGEAEQRKRTLGLEANGGDGAEMLIIQGQLQPLKDELLLFIKYFEEKTGEAISKVLLAGGTASLTGIDEYFASNLGLAVTQAQPVEAIESQDETARSTTFLVVLGLARIAFGEHKAAINFLSRSEKDWLPGKKFDSGKRLARTSAETQAKGSPSTGSGEKNNRMLLLVVILIIMAVLFGGVFAWKYLPIDELLSGKQVTIVPAQPEPQRNVELIVRPYSASDLAMNDKTFSFQFSLEVGGGDTSGETVFSARKEDVLIEGDVQYDQGTVDYVRREFEQGVYGEQEFDDVIIDLMSDRLWMEEYTALLGEYPEDRLLDTYLTKTITATELTEADESGISTLSITMNVTLLLVQESDAFTQYEDEQVAFYKDVSDAGDIIQKRYYYTEDGSRIRVQSIYQFE